MAGNVNLSVVDDKSLANLGAQLVKLNMSSCSIKQVPAEAFRSVQESLTILDLSNNSIDSLSDIHLHALYKLQVLFLGEQAKSEKRKVFSCIVDVNAINRLWHVRRQRDSGHQTGFLYRP